MRKIVLTFLLIPILIMALAAPVIPRPTDSSDQDVWQMEELYWKTAQAADPDAYMKLWHPNFLGWPRDWEAPGGRSTLEKAVRTKMSTSHIAGYKFLSKAVQVTGNAAITQYAVESQRLGKDSKVETFTSRITHTWLNTEGHWQIIGGMSAPLEPSGHTW